MRAFRSPQVAEGFVIAASIQGIIQNSEHGPSAETGVLLTAYLAAATATAWSWSTDLDGVVSTSETFTPIIGTNVTDGAVLDVDITHGGGTEPSPSFTIRHVPPVGDPVPDQDYDEDVAISALDLAGYVTGSDLSFALAPGSPALPAGLSLSGAGVLSGTPTDTYTAADVTVRATNSGGLSDLVVNIEVAAGVGGGFANGDNFIGGLAAAVNSDNAIAGGASTVNSDTAVGGTSA